MTARPERAAPCRAPKRPTDVRFLCAALALCGEAVEPRLDIGDAKPIKPQGADSRLDVVLHMALVCRVGERGKIRGNRVFEPSMEKLPNCRTAVTTGPRAAFRVSSTHRPWTISRLRP